MHPASEMGCKDFQFIIIIDFYTPFLIFYASYIVDLDALCLPAEVSAKIFHL